MQYNTFSRTRAKYSKILSLLFGDMFVLQKELSIVNSEFAFPLRFNMCKLELNHGDFLLSETSK